MLYQAIFHKYGEHIHVPIEADTQEQAFGIAKRENAQLESWPLTVKPVQTGEEIKDDRAELKFVAERKMGRPSQGREKRMQFNATADIADALERLRIKRGEKSISNVIFDLVVEGLHHAE